MNPDGLPTFFPGRGGQWTYNGPGQVVAYLMLDLRSLYAPQAPDLKHFIRRLEAWIITTLADYGVAGFTISGRTGVWVTPAAPQKIAAIGVRVRHGVSYHGVSINLAPDLAHYRGIVPCGIADAGVTSLAALGHQVSKDAVMDRLEARWSEMGYAS